jgi:hypothetical protein
MPSSTAAPADPDSWLTKLVHRSASAYLYITIPQSLALCLAIWIDTLPSPKAAFLAVVAVSTINIWCAIFWIAHTRRICPLDIPTDFLGDPQKAAQDNMHHLRLVHRIPEIFQILIMGMPFLPGLLFNVISGQLDDRPLWLRISICIIDLAASAALTRLLFAHKKHDRLELWCPWCRRRRGDDDITPAPTPEPVGGINPSTH